MSPPPTPLPPFPTHPPIRPGGTTLNGGPSVRSHTLHRNPRPCPPPPEIRRHKSLGLGVCLGLAARAAPIRSRYLRAPSYRRRSASEHGCAATAAGHISLSLALLAVTSTQHPIVMPCSMACCSALTPPGPAVRAGAVGAGRWAVQGPRAGIRKAGEVLLGGGVTSRPSTGGWRLAAAFFVWGACGVGGIGGHNQGASGVG